MDHDALTQEVFQTVLQLHRTTPQRKLTDFSRGEVFVLNVLAHGEGRAMPGELSNALGVSSARMAAAVNSLERKGDVIRVPDETDRRRVQVMLTDAGRQRLLSCQEQVRQKLGDMLNALGEADTRELLRILKRLVAITQAGQEAGTKQPETSEGENEC